MARDLLFPDIRDALYAGNSIDDIQERYITALRSEYSLSNFLYANKLEEGQNMLNIHNLHELEQEFHDLKEYLRMWSKKHNVHVFIKRRKKGWIGYNEKIQLFLLHNRSLDKILDLLGFRIILCTDNIDSIESVKLLYELQNEIMQFFIEKKHCIFLEAEPRIDTNFNSKEFNDIVIPRDSLLYEEFIPFVKDYVRYPKNNAYQSLHCVIRKPNGLTFEVQVRTYAMDLVAEHGTGAHTSYKNQRYTELDFGIDYSKINIPGFIVLPDGSINDIVGLQHSVDPFNFL